MLPEGQRLKICTISWSYGPKLSATSFPRMDLVNHGRGDSWW